ncbi:hypothetical protein L195_g020535 [Trifolium pratense]|uniref:WRKY transcription factor n=1 Tax=Trifolium pratense TaxID=57577 RepID=A0A2K3N2U1_TRIPR|nr:hypothetical protein L195_g020535 [Trifolium pratense]
MDNYQGDLTDIIRAPGTTTATATTTAGAYSTTGTSSSSSEYVLQHLHDNQWHHHNHNHQLFSSSDHLHRQHHHQHQHQHQQQQQNMSFINSVLEGTNMNNMFGDPLFSTLRDPFLQELDHIPSSSYFNITTNTTTTTAATTTTASPASTSIINVSDVSNSIFALDHNHNHEIRSNSRPCKNIFSNMIQISPNPKLPSNYESSSTMAPSPRQIKQVVSTNININANISKDSLLDNTGVQISSSRNSSGLKRR